jgi:archaetidylinositol phosphate synthase
MIEQGVRRYYQRLLVDPLAIQLKNKIQPNTITWLSGLFGVLVIPALLFHQVILAISLLLLSGYLDTLDGTLARFTQHSTTWGSVLDIMMDRLVEFSAVFALCLVNPTHRALWCFLMLASMLFCITSFLVVGIFVANDSQKSFHYSPGIMERAEAFVFYIAMMCWPNAFVGMALLFSLLVVLTAVIRLVQFYQQVTRQAVETIKSVRSIQLSQLKE